MTRYHYVHIKINNIPEEIIVESNLQEKATNDGHVYIEIQKGMYGSPQAGILAQQLSVIGAAFETTWAGVLAK